MKLNLLHGARNIWISVGNSFIIYLYLYLNLRNFYGYVLTRPIVLSVGFSEVMGKWLRVIKGSPTPIRTLPLIHSLVKISLQPALFWSRRQICVFFNFWFLNSPPILLLCKHTKHFCCNNV